jgi:hypothetical protein
MNYLITLNQSPQHTDKMKLFSKVHIQSPKAGKEYIATAQVNQVAFDDREGPYYWVQEVNKGAAQRIKKANFKEGKFIHHSELAS